MKETIEEKAARVKFIVRDGFKPMYIYLDLKNIPMTERMLKKYNIRAKGKYMWIDFLPNDLCVVFLKVRNKNRNIVEQMIMEIKNNLLICTKGSEEAFVKFVEYCMKVNQKQKG